MARKKTSESDNLSARVTALFQEWDGIHRRMEDDQALFELEIQPVKEGYETVQWPDPWNIGGLTVTLLTSDPLRWKRPLKYGSTDTKAVEAAGSQVERAMAGIIGEADSLLVRRGLYGMHESLAWFGTLRGWIVAQAFHTGKQEGFPFQIQPWDPLECACEYDDAGLSFFVHAYDERVGAVKQRGEVLGWKTGELTGDDTDIIRVQDIWTPTQNGCLAGNTMVKPMADHGLDRCPIVMLPVGGTPLSRAQGALVSYQNRMQGRGQSVLYGAAESIRYSNRLASQIADVFAVYSNPIVVATTNRGRVINIDLRRGAVIQLQPGEKIEFIRPPGMPGDIAAWAGMVNEKIQQSSYPSSMYGNAEGGQFTGVALSMLGNAAKRTPRPIDRRICACMEEVGKLVLEQWDKFGGQLRVMGSKGRNRVVEEYDPSILGGDYNITCEHETWMPQDRAANANIARMLVGGDEPLISPTTARDEYLMIQDPAGEQQRIIDDRVALNPEVMDMLAKATGIVKVIDNLQMLVKRKAITPQQYRRILSVAGLSEESVAPPEQQRQGPPGMGGAPGMPPGGEAIPPEIASALAGGQGQMQPQMQPGIQQAGMPMGMPPGVPGMPPEVAPTAAVIGPQQGMSPEEQILRAMLGGGGPPGRGG